MGIIIVSAFFLVVIVAAAQQTPMTIKGHTQDFLDGLQLSANEFYQEIKEGLKERQITQVAITEKSFLETHALSAKRLYLKITQREYVYYICAAPYGTGTFVSSWFCIKNENFVNRIPLLSKLVGADRNNKTFYQMDTEAMFKLAVQSTFWQVVSSKSDVKGLRGMPELQGHLKQLQ